MGYGAAKFSGYMATDLVCLSDYGPQGSTCVNNFDFFVVTKQSGMINGVDGILGLGPPVKANGPSFVQNLYLGGVISQPVVSFQVTSDGSTAQFGIVDQTSYVGSMIYHEQVPQRANWWTFNLGSASYGSQNIKSSNWKYAIVDTGSQFLYMAGPDYQNFVSAVQKSGKNSAKLDCTSKVYCFSNKYTCKQLEKELSPLSITLD